MCMPVYLLRPCVDGFCSAIDYRWMVGLWSEYDHGVLRGLFSGHDLEATQSMNQSLSRAAFVFYN